MCLDLSYLKPLHAQVLYTLQNGDGDLSGSRQPSQENKRVALVGFWDLTKVLGTTEGANGMHEAASRLELELELELEMAPEHVSVSSWKKRLLSVGWLDSR